MPEGLPSLAGLVAQVPGAPGGQPLRDSVTRLGDSGKKPGGASILRDPYHHVDTRTNTRIRYEAPRWLIVCTASSAQKLLTLDLLRIGSGNMLVED